MAEKNKKRANTSSVRQAFLMGGIVLFLVGLSSIGTLYVSGALTGERFAKTVARKRMTLVDAQLLCDSETRRQLGRRIHSIAVDNHSSRYDDYSDRFMIFYNAELYEDESRQGFSKPYFINCYSYSDREKISHYEVMEDAEMKTRPIREHKGGAFGY